MLLKGPFTNLLFDGHTIHEGDTYYTFGERKILLSPSGETTYLGREDDNVRLLRRKDRTMIRVEYHEGANSFDTFWFYKDGDVYYPRGGANRCGVTFKKKDNVPPKAGLAQR